MRKITIQILRNYKVIKSLLIECIEIIAAIFLYINNLHPGAQSLCNMKRVLIVDDEIDLCLLLKQFFTKRNYEVHIAHNLSDGLNILNTIKPDTLMLDNNLPDGMGWDLADEIHEKYPAMNLTLISAYQLAKDFKHKLDGSINFLEKPISLNDIEKYI